jgi:hypothetical protein
MKVLNLARDLSRIERNRRLKIELCINEEAQM